MSTDETLQTLRAERDAARAELEFCREEIGILDSRLDCRRDYGIDDPPGAKPACWEIGRDVCRWHAVERWQAEINRAPDAPARAYAEYQEAAAAGLRGDPDPGEHAPWWISAGHHLGATTRMIEKFARFDDEDRARMRDIIEAEPPAPLPPGHDPRCPVGGDVRTGPALWWRYPTPERTGEPEAVLVTLDESSGLTWRRVVTTGQPPSYHVCDDGYWGAPCRPAAPERSEP